MALGLQTGGGGTGAKPFIKYDARAGRMFRVDRAQDGTGMWVTDNVDITTQASFVADMANIEVGWINFSEQQGPIKAMAVLGKAAVPERPPGTDKNGKPAFKQGFLLQVAMPKDLGGGVREFSSTAGCVIEAVDQLHDAYNAAAESKAGKLPVVSIGAVQAVKSGQSTNYKPIFEIKAWVDRPPTLVAPAPPTNGSEPVAANVRPDYRQTPPATGATQVKPPAAVTPPWEDLTPATAGDFG